MQANMASHYMGIIGGKMKKRWRMQQLLQQTLRLQATLPEAQSISRLNTEWQTPQPSQGDEGNIFCLHQRAPRFKGAVSKKLHKLHNQTYAERKQEQSSLKTV